MYITLNSENACNVSGEIRDAIVLPDYRHNLYQPAVTHSLRTVMNLKQNFMKQFISDLLSITCIHLVDSDQHGVELKCKYFHPSNWSTNKFARRQTI